MNSKQFASNLNYVDEEHLILQTMEAICIPGHTDMHSSNDMTEHVRLYRNIGFNFLNDCPVSMIAKGFLFYLFFCLCTT